MHDKPISMLRKNENIITGSGMSNGTNYSSEQNDNDTYRGIIRIRVDINW